jgi:hypothetical protein
MTDLRAYVGSQPAASPQIHDRPATNTTPIEDCDAMIITRFVESGRRAALRRGRTLSSAPTAAIPDVSSKGRRRNAPDAAIADGSAQAISRVELVISRSRPMF